jgi:hypothetical protein
MNHPRRPTLPPVERPNGGDIILRPISTSWLAIAGLCVIGLASVVVASASAPLTAGVLGTRHIALEATLTQILLAGTLCGALALALLARSRLAFGITLGIGLASMAWWVVLAASRDPAALHRLTVLVAAAGMLIVAGLGLDVGAYWARSDGGDADRAGLNPPRGADHGWRRPR